MLPVFISLILQEFPECVEDVIKRKSHPYFSWKVWEDKEKSNEKGTEMNKLKA